MISAPLCLEETSSHFPYGTVPVGDDVRTQYNRFDLSHNYPLPEQFPLRHPLLRTIERIFHGSLPGNWYDTGAAVAALLPRGADIWTGSDRWHEGILLAQTTLRVMFDETNHPFIVIGQCYGTDETSILSLLALADSQCERSSYQWAMMDSYGLCRRMSDGSMGQRYQRGTSEKIFLEGPPCWLPEGIYPPLVDAVVTWQNANDQWVFPKTVATHYFPKR